MNHVIRSAYKALRFLASVLTPSPTPVLTFAQEIQTLLIELESTLSEVEELNKSVKILNPMFSSFERTLNEVRNEGNRLRDEISTCHHTLASLRGEDGVQQTLRNYQSRIHCLKNSIVYLRDHLEVHMEWENQSENTRLYSSYSEDSNSAIFSESSLTACPVRDSEGSFETTSNKDNNNNLKLQSAQQETWCEVCYLKNLNIRECALMNIYLNTYFLKNCRLPWPETARLNCQSKCGSYGSSL